MRSSSILTLIGATLAIASPVHFKLHKKAIEWDIVTDIVYVTVTEGQLPKSHPETTVTVKHTHFVNPVPAPTSKKVVPTTSSTPPPPPTTTSTPPPPPATTEAPAPAPTTEEAVKVVVSSVAPVQAVASPEPQAAAAPVAETSGEKPTTFESAAVYYHNLARGNHSADGLTWSSSLAASAQQLADTCHFGHDMGINGGNYGQNIDMQGSSSNTAANWNKADIIAQSVTNSWYLPEEATFAANNAFGQANPDVMGMNAAHFTQVVWKGTTTVGCAVKYCGTSLLGATSYQWYTVCNYGPPGNYAGEYATNVGKSLREAGPTVISPFEQEFGPQ